jgi:diguanylate cyclase (GGDEF)-like protein
LPAGRASPVSPRSSPDSAGSHDLVDVAVLDEDGVVPLAERAGGSTASVAASALCIAITTIVAASAAFRPPDESVRSDVLALVGVITAAALIAASFRLRSLRAQSWSRQSDPFIAFAAAATMLAVPSVVPALTGSTGGVWGGHTWVTSSVASVFAAAGFLIMIRDLTPRRAIDALFLAAIGAFACGLATWVAILRLLEEDVISTGPAIKLVAPMVLDLVVVGLGLQALNLRARARHGFGLLVLGWSCVLATDFAGLVVGVAGRTLSSESIAVGGLAVFGLLSAAALHPDTSFATEPVFGSLRRLPRSQIVLLGVAVLLGPAVLSLGLRDRAVLALVVPLSGVLSLLVVTYLVRLVQGRAVLEHRAHHDELTGLANRRLFQEEAAGALAHARRIGGHSAVLFLDLDRFKNVNDSLGHSVGNLLLQAVAKRLRTATRAEDTVARLGGDEFVVFLPQLDSPEEATLVAQKILERFSEPFTLNGLRLFASPSIGIATFPGDGTDADSLLENADVAMYRAKQRGRKTFCAYDRTMNDHAHERLKLENQLHTAVERGEMRLHYQPKIHLPTGRVTGMEALLRWQHPELGLLQPSSFISLAEESGLIVPVGEWALEEACRQNQAWVEAGFHPLVVAVNLSLRQFQQQQISDVIARILRKTGMRPALLELEVTESLVMQDPEDVCRTILELKGLGVQCSIDDFGTGYSGLSHLSGLPLDKLKIDRSFVATITEDRAAPIVVAVVALGHGLGLQVVAEGVETTDQLERLQELGCDEMQGYLFSRPLPPDRFEQLLMLESISPGPGRLVPLPGSTSLVQAVG